MNRSVVSIRPGKGLIALIALLCMFPLTVSASPVAIAVDIRIDRDNRTVEPSTYLGGLVFEGINDAADGEFRGGRVQDRSFEHRPRGAHAQPPAAEVRGTTRYEIFKPN